MDKLESCLSFELQKLKYLKRCVGRQGRLDHDENFDKFVIGVRKPLCLDLLRNSAHDYLFDEKPTEFNILISAHNNVYFKFKTRSKLIIGDIHVQSKLYNDWRKQTRHEIEGCLYKINSYMSNSVSIFIWLIHLVKYNNVYDWLFNEIK